MLGVVPAAQPMLEVLDLLYTGTEEVEAMAQQYGLEVRLNYMWCNSVPPNASKHTAYHMFGLVCV